MPPRTQLTAAERHALDKLWAENPAGRRRCRTKALRAAGQAGHSRLHAEYVQAYSWNVCREAPSNPRPQAPRWDPHPHPRWGSHPHPRHRPLGTWVAAQSLHINRLCTSIICKIDSSNNNNRDGRARSWDSGKLQLRCREQSGTRTRRCRSRACVSTRRPSWTACEDA